MSDEIVRDEVIRGAASGRPKLEKRQIKGWHAERRTAFLEHLVTSCNIKASCRAVGMIDNNVHGLRKTYPDFAVAWDEALKEGYRRLEIAMLGRATNGALNSVWHDGKRVGRDRQYSDGIGLKLLAQHAARTSIAVIGAFDDAAVAQARASIEARIRLLKLRAGEIEDDADEN